MDINKIIYNIKYTYPTTNVLSYFENLKGSLIENVSAGNISDKILEKLETDKGSEQVQGICNLMEKTFLENKTKVDGFECSDKILSTTGIDFLNSLQVEDLGYALKVTVAFDGIYNVFFNSGRNFSTETLNSNIKNTSYILKNTFNGYSNDPYSLAFKSDDYSIALAVTHSSKSHKTEAILKVIEVTTTNLNIEDGSKYFNIAPFTKGIST